jgi:hypothetical protein
MSDWKPKPSPKIARIEANRCFREFIRNYEEDYNLGMTPLGEAVGGVIIKVIKDWFPPVL